MEIDILVAGLIGSVQFVGLLTVPESPKWLTMAKMMLSVLHLY